MDNGGLVRVLEDWDLGSMELSAVFAGGRRPDHHARRPRFHGMRQLGAERLGPNLN